MQPRAATRAKWADFKGAMSEAFTYTRNRGTTAGLVNHNGATVEANENGRIVLEFMAGRGMNVTDSVPLDEIMDFGIDSGLSLSEIEGALVHASVKEWVLVVGSDVHLSQAGYRLIGSANDNSE